MSKYTTAQQVTKTLKKGVSKLGGGKEGVEYHTSPSPF